ncbi:c-type cytochrome [Fulvivirgaceae bacterium PWU4]|uniref:C-type cytochrome n=1 Tax=Chryseosolibacter histidini TaxID=2782349 RepID=A0AAP2DI88_9BACT|nr:cbb3-type cytochrome c oxidase N-terminal domain-containing protein [Chryseosolibacter histidini]MBT1695863.1 c-type cytochrome [Chryseosolibacter histidini]
MKKPLLILSGCLFAASTFAQENTAKTFWDDPVNHPLASLYVVTALLLVVVILVAFVGIYMVKVLNTLTEQARKVNAEKSGIAYVPLQSWWQRFAQRMNASVPVEQEKNIEMDHSYDGIRELDNHLPPWWKWLFYGTIGWSVVYIIVFHFSASLPLSLEEYQQEVAVAEEQARKLRASQPEATIDENALQYTADAAIIEKGKTVFMNNPCGSCHRNDGGGNTIGPNLTDEYWLHGGDVKNIFNTIKNGVVEKGMPAWGKSMSPQDVRDLTFFVMSLQGTKPADAKAPQGELFKQTPVGADTTATQASL